MYPSLQNKSLKNKTTNLREEKKNRNLTSNQRHSCIPLKAVAAFCWLLSLLDDWVKVKDVSAWPLVILCPIKGLPCFVWGGVCQLLSGENVLSTQRSGSWTFWEEPEFPQSISAWKNLGRGDRGLTRHTVPRVQTRGHVTGHRRTGSDQCANVWYSQCLTETGLCHEMHLPE